MSDELRARRARLAWIAFLFHGIGLRFFTDFRFSRELFRANLWGLGLSLLAAALAFALTPIEERWMAALIVFALGHFAWGAYLSRWVYRNG